MEMTDWNNPKLDVLSLEQGDVELLHWKSAGSESRAGVVSLQFFNKKNQMPSSQNSKYLLCNWLLPTHHIKAHKIQILASAKWQIIIYQEPMSMPKNNKKVYTY